MSTPVSTTHTFAGAAAAGVAGEGGETARGAGPRRAGGSPPAAARASIACGVETSARAAGAADAAAAITAAVAAAACRARRKWVVAAVGISAQFCRRTARSRLYVRPEDLAEPWRGFGERRSGAR